MSRQLALFVALAIVFFVAGLLAAPLVSRLVQKLHRMNSASKLSAPPFDSLGYEQKSSQFAALGATRQIVFLGDSRIEHGQWSELFARSDISNRGISGDTTAGIVRRLSTSVPTDGILCIVQAGINDLSQGASIANVVENYRRIVDYLRVERHADVVVTSIILASKDRAELNGEITQCNQQLMQLTTAQSVRWVDLNAALCPRGFLPPNLTTDGVHLNGAGYIIVRDQLAPLLEAAR